MTKNAPGRSERDGVPQLFAQPMTTRPNAGSRRNAGRLALSERRCALPDLPEIVHRDDSKLGLRL